MCDVGYELFVDWFGLVWVWCGCGGVVVGWCCYGGVVWVMDYFLLGVFYLLCLGWCVLGIDSLKW